MTHSLFQIQMNRLAETFGQNHYRTERVEILWQEVQANPDDWFRRVVDKFIGECRQAPLLSEFRTEISRERERTQISERTTKSSQHFWETDRNYKCKTCNDTGNVLARCRERNSLFAFKCGCLIGRRVGIAVPEWSSKYELLYENLT